MEDRVIFEIDCCASVGCCLIPRFTIGRRKGIDDQQSLMEDYHIELVFELEFQSMVDHLISLNSTIY